MTCVRTDGERLIGIQGEFFFYGNNVRDGPASLATSARRSVLDTAHPLPFGQLTNFYLYVSSAAGQATTAERRIQLQIWRLLSNVSSSYRLVWQQLAFVNTTSTSGALLTVSTSVFFLFIIIIIVVIEFFKVA